MSVIYTPDNVCTVDTDDNCSGDFCPTLLEGCKNGCYHIKTCTDIRIDLPLGCNPFTKDDLRVSDLTEVEIKGTYKNDSGVVVVFVWTLTDNPTIFEVAGAFQYTLVVPPELTASFPSGIISVEIWFTTADGTYQPYDFPMCIEREDLADPCVVVTGSAGAPSAFTIVGDTVTVWLHESDTVHFDRTWDRFEVDWGDGTIDTLDVSALQPPSSGTWTISHAYASSGNYDLSITGYLNYDDQDACDQELSDCAVATICVEV